jgi:hypothetical protein
MNPRPTYDDANLILRLYDTRREERLRAARAWFTSKCKGLKTYDELVKLAGPGTDENASFRMVTTYWDMVASFITSGVLNKDLFFQSGRELLLVYVRIGDVLPSIREAYTRTRTSSGTSKRWGRTSPRTGRRRTRTPTRRS